MIAVVKTKKPYLLLTIIVWNTEMSNFGALNQNKNFLVWAVINDLLFRVGTTEQSF